MNLPALRSGVLAAILLALTGCTMVGPDFEEPEADWLDTWDQSLHGLTTEEKEGERPELAFWWTMFNDPVLNQLIELAHQNNRQLRIAALRIFESRALLGIAGSSLYPQVQQITGAISYTDRQNSANPDAITNGSRTAYNAGFNIAWEMDFWGRFRRSIESADAAFFASVENQRAVQVLINVQVVDLYFSYRVTQARMAIARKNAKIQERSFHIATELYRSGNTSELDLQQAKTQYLSTLSTIPQLERTLIQIRNALAVLLARPPGDLPQFETDKYQLPLIDRTMVTAIPARLLLRRPDIRASVWQVASQSAQIGVAKADFYPSISLLGTLGWSGSNRTSAGTTTTVGVGPALNWNIFTYGRIENNVRLQDARLQQLIEQYQDAVLQAAAEVDNAAISVVKTAEQLRLLQKTVKSARRALAIANTRYQEGYSDFQRVLDAQRSLFSTTDRLISTRGDNIGAIISLYKGLGGGWSPAETKRLLPPATIDQMKQRVDWGNLLEAPLPLPPLPASQPPASPASPESDTVETSL